MTLLRSVIVVGMTVLGFIVGYAVGSDDDGNAIPTQSISGVVELVNPDGSKVCVNTGSEANPTGVCSRNVSDVDVRVGDEVTGLVLTVPVEGGTQELLYLETG